MRYVRPTVRQLTIAAVLLEGAVLLGLLAYLAATERVLLVRFATRESLARTEAVERLIVPVAGVRAAELRDTWGAARSGGRSHKGIDIFADRGTPVLAAASGILVRRDSVGAGGIALYLRGLDGRTVHYYAHLDRIRPGLKAGDLLRRGDVVGFVGQTGNASSPHLHFGVFTVATPNTVRPLRELNPYPLLRQDAEGGAGP